MRKSSFCYNSWGFFYLSFAVKALGYKSLPIKFLSIHRDLVEYLNYLRMWQESKAIFCIHMSIFLRNKVFKAFKGKYVHETFAYFQKKFKRFTQCELKW